MWFANVEFLCDSGLWALKFRVIWHIMSLHYWIAFWEKNNYRESENKKPKLLMFLFIFPMRLIWVLRILRLVQCCNNFLCQATTSAPLERSALWVSAWERNIDLAPECHGWPTSSDSQKKTCGSLKAKGVFNFEAELIRMIRTATRHDGIQPATLCKIGRNQAPRPWSGLPAIPGW